MKKITSRKKTAFFLILFGFLLFIISSCSFLNTTADKRKYNDRVYVGINKEGKQKVVAEQKDKEIIGLQKNDNGIEELTNFIASNNGSSIIITENKNDKILFLPKTATKESQISVSKNSLEKTTRTKNEIRKLEKQNKKNVLSDDIPCPRSNKTWKILGVIFMILGLCFLSVPDITVLLIGLGASLLGLIFWIVGRAIPDPYIKKTELISDSTSNALTALKVPQFDYTATASTNEKEISLALLTPKYAEDFIYKGVSPFSEFAKSMEKDFEEVLYERQYTFIGPFKEYDDMVFSEKSKTDLLLEVEIDISWKENIQSSPINIKQYANEFWSCGAVRKVVAGIATKYSFEGKAGIGADINIKASEIMTREKVWVKKISIDPQYITVKSGKLYNDNIKPDDIWTKDPGFYNPMVTFLEEYYKVIMGKAWNYLDPNELKLLKPQIEKIREKSMYNRE